MKKYLFLSFVLLAGVLFSAPSTFAQSTESQRLYEEFLKALRDQQNYTQQEVTPDTTTPSMPETKPQPKVSTSKYSVSGKVVRSNDGKYFITTDEKPSRTLRVYGQEAAKDIMKAVLYEKVQLIGDKAFFNGKEVGISAKQVVVLVGSPEKTVTPEKKPEPVKTTKPAWVETTFTGEIEISDKGVAYLITMENGKKVTRRLLNEKDWKKAFQHAFKGQVQVRGYLTETGAIRYSDIY